MDDRGPPGDAQAINRELRACANGAITSTVRNVSTAKTRMKPTRKMTNVGVSVRSVPSPAGAIRRGPSAPASARTARMPLALGPRQASPSLGDESLSRQQEDHSKQRYAHQYRGKKRENIHRGHDCSGHVKVVYRASPCA